MDHGGAGSGVGATRRACCTRSDTHNRRWRCPTTSCYGIGQWPATRLEWGERRGRKKKLVGAKRTNSNSCLSSKAVWISTILSICFLYQNKPPATSPRSSYRPIHGLLHLYASPSCTVQPPASCPSPEMSLPPHKKCCLHRRQTPHTPRPPPAPPALRVRRYRPPPQARRCPPRDANAGGTNVGRSSDPAPLPPAAPAACEQRRRPCVCGPLALAVALADHDCPPFSPPAALRRYRHTPTSHIRTPHSRHLYTIRPITIG